MSTEPLSDRLTGAGPAPEEEHVFLQYARVILKRKWVLVLFFFLTVLAVMTYTFRQRPTYKATSSVIIDARPPRVLSNVSDVVDLGTGQYWSNREYYETQYRIIASRKIADEVVERLGLSEDTDFLGLDVLQDPELREQARAAADPAALLMGRASVSPVKLSYVVQIGVEDWNPERAARLANTLAESYIDNNLTYRSSATDRATSELGEQFEDLKGRLEQSENALYEFKRDNDVLSTSLEDRQNMTVAQMMDLNSSLSDVRKERLRLGARLRQLDKSKQESDAKLGVALEEVIQNPLVQSLKQSYLTLRKKRDELKVRYLDDHPEVRSLTDQISTVEKELRKEVATIISNLRAKHAGLSETEWTLNARLKGVKTEAQAVNQREVEYKRLVRATEINRRLYDMVLNRLKETSLTKNMAFNNIRILDRALVPVRPIRPRKARSLLFAMFLGLFGGGVLAVFVEFLDNTVKTREDVEIGLGLPFLGIVPTIGPVELEGLDRDHYLLENRRSVAAECLRTIRTNILFMSPDRPISRLLVTSAAPREGKTTVAVSVAATMAESGKRTLLLDTDMRKPRLHRVFGLDNDRGISNLILGDVEPAGAIRPTGIENLDLITCGPIPPNPAELLHTGAFHDVLERLSRMYDRIVLDSPPVVAVADALILAHEVDGAMVVIEANQSEWPMARQAVQALRDVNAKVLGAVLNNVDLRARHYGRYAYYRGYYRRYGPYGGPDDSAGEQSAPATA